MFSLIVVDHPLRRISIRPVAFPSAAHFPQVWRSSRASAPLSTVVTKTIPKLCLCAVKPHMPASPFQCSCRRAFPYAATSDTSRPARPRAAARSHSLPVDFARTFQMRDGDVRKRRRPERACSCNSRTNTPLTQAVGVERSSSGSAHDWSGARAPGNADRRSKSAAGAGRRKVLVHQRRSGHVASDGPVTVPAHTPCGCARHLFAGGCATPDDFGSTVCALQPPPPPRVRFACVKRPSPLVCSKPHKAARQQRTSSSSASVRQFVAVVIIASHARAAEPTARGMTPTRRSSSARAALAADSRRFEMRGVSGIPN